MKTPQSALSKFFTTRIESITPATAGVVNQTWIVNTGGTKYVLREYAASATLTQIQYELMALGMFARHGVAVPQVLPSLARRPIVRLRGKKGRPRYFVLFSYIAGKHLSARQHALMPEVAQVQAQMHRIAKRYITPREELASVYRGIFNYLKSELEKSEHSFRRLGTWDSIAQVQADLREYFVQHGHALLQLPSAEAHSDYSSDNILAKNGRLQAVLDFGELRHVPLVLDIGNSLHWYLANNSLRAGSWLLSRYLRSYNKKRRLQSRELRHLPFFMRVRNITLLAFFYGSALPGSEKAPGVYLKMDEFLARLKVEKL